MIFNPASPMAQRLLLRKSGHLLYGSANSSIENVFVGRRRSLSLDDLGLNGLDFENSLKKERENYHSITSNIDDTDEDLDEELPYQDDSATFEASRHSTPKEPGAKSLSTISESFDEWSPSPPVDVERRTQSSDPNISQKPISLSMVQSYLNKWKKKIKK